MNEIVRAFVALLPLATFPCAAEEHLPLNPGYVHGQYTLSGKWEIKAGVTKLDGSFSGKTTAKSFECSWVFDRENKSGWGKSTGTVKIDEDGGEFSQNGLAEKRYSDSNLALAAASGVSYGSVPLVYGLWTGDRSAVFPLGKVKVEKAGDKIVVSADDGFKTVTIVGGVLASVRTEIDHSEQRVAASREVTDEEVRQSLKALGIAASKERMDEMRSILEADRENAKDSLDNTVTTITVTVDGLPK